MTRRDFFLFGFVPLFSCVLFNQQRSNLKLMALFASFTVLKLRSTLCQSSLICVISMEYIVNNSSRCMPVITALRKRRMGFIFATLRTSHQMKRNGKPYNIPRHTNAYMHGNSIFYTLYNIGMLIGRIYHPLTNTSTFTYVTTSALIHSSAATLS